MASLAGTARVLDLDRDLAALLPEPVLMQAREVSAAALLELERGPWTQMPTDVDPGAIGFLVVEGLLSCTIEVSGRANIELIGPGDLIRPWVEADATVPQDLSWNVLLPARMAWLDRDFAMRMGAWPEVGAAIVDRLVLRARHLLFQRAVGSIPRVDERLLLVLWDFADRWGKVRVDGIHLALPLSHSLLASVVGAQRPSVTTALGKLRRDGRLEQVPGGWLLHGDPPAAVEADRGAPLLMAAAGR